MLNLLLVEDDEYFREAVRGVLVDQGWKVTVAPDGKVARDVIKVSPPFDLIVSDIQMPFLSGVELLEWVKANKPTHFVLMTGFALVMETQRAHELGADEFLAKPFETGDLIKVIQKVCREKLNAGKTPAVGRIAPRFCKVSLTEFVGSTQLNFDVHIKLGSRYVKIGRKGDSVPVDRIHTYKEKGLKYLYVDKEDFRNLVSFNLTLAKTVALTDKVDKEKKASFMRYTSEVVLERVFITGVDEESFYEAKEFLSTSMDVLTDDPTALSLIDSLNSYSDQIYAHSLSASIYGVIIAREMGWTSTANLFKLSLAGLFHDIGKKEIDREILLKPRPLLTHAERKLIESHPQRGHEILLTMPSMPSEVVAVAYEHHEDQIGTGFPRGLDKHTIHPYSQIIRMANLFSEYTLRSPNSPGMTAAQAIHHLAVHYRDTVSKDAFVALCKAFKIPMPAEAA